MRLENDNLAPEIQEGDVSPEVWERAY